MEVEKTALETELTRDPSARLRLDKCKEELAQCREELGSLPIRVRKCILTVTVTLLLCYAGPLRMRHQEEKGRVAAIRETQLKIEAVTLKLAQAQRLRDTGLVADLQYGARCWPNRAMRSQCSRVAHAGALPDLERRLERLKVEKKAMAGAGLLSEIVGPDQVRVAS